MKRRATARKPTVWTEAELHALEAEPQLLHGEVLQFRVFAKPAPQGSKAPTGRLYTGRDGKTHEALAESSKRHRPWRKLVRQAAWVAVNQCSWVQRAGPVRLDVWFYRLPPVSPKRARWCLPDKIPDYDKLARSIGDAMSEVVYDDDKRITDAHVYKRFGRPGCLVRVTELSVLLNEEKRR